MEELANNFVFRYVSNNKHFNINQLIKIIKYPTNDMILDVITRSNKLEPLRFTPFVIDFDVKDEEKNQMTTADLLEQFKIQVGKNLDNDRILLSGVADK